MTTVLTVVGAFGVLLAPFAVVWLAGTALLGAVRLATGRVERTHEVVLAMIVRVLVIVSIAASALVFADVAEGRNEWVDTDGNGMLDPMVNGGYDWFDINGGDWVRMWGVASLVIVAAGWWMLLRCTPAERDRASR